MAAKNNFFEFQETISYGVQQITSACLGFCVLVLGGEV